MRKRFSCIVVVLGLVGCASLSNDDNIDLSDVDNAAGETLAFNTQTGVMPYTFNQKKLAVEWMSCRKKDGKDTATFILVNGDEAAVSANFCNGWLAQSFLKAGYDVLAVNRPGFGKSTAAKDFSGPASQVAIATVADAAAKTDKDLKKVVGIWGYGSGATAAAFVAKKSSKFKYLIGGAGIYDLEAYYNGDGKMKNSVKDAMGSQDASAFFEARSVAWDIDGLPKTIFLYHGRTDDVVSPKQSESFRDTLASSEYQVKLSLIDGLGHDISPAKHKVILASALATLK